MRTVIILEELHRFTDDELLQPVTSDETVSVGGTVTLTCRVAETDNSSLQWSNTAQQTLYFGEKRDKWLPLLLPQRSHNVTCQMDCYYRRPAGKMMLRSCLTMLSDFKIKLAVYWMYQSVLHFLPWTSHSHS
ncbi:hypothetical protein CHARACLAT_019464 [Characodon lateralis]|uniref:Ig-like domain-containing protein n=1 Tax=Characodon lateralis TaxID=208331 RepID=A0ABU7ELR8_9TELE|nr:hypothetical protein [Characodon lateralis]